MEKLARALYIVLIIWLIGEYFIGSLWQSLTESDPLPRIIGRGSVSKAEERHHSSDHNIANETVVTIRDLVKRPGTKSMLAQTSETERSSCSFRIQIYDKKHTKEIHMLMGIGESQGSKSVYANATCSNDCNIEVIINGDDNFSGVDAVVFGFMNTPIPGPLPRADTNVNQTWVYFTWESPCEKFGNGALKRIQSLWVHATWTYHRSSDITTPYGWYQHGTPMAYRNQSADEWLEGKTKFAILMMSNCKYTCWPRMRFVQKLMQHMSVDVYGSCGHLKCMPKSSQKCLGDLLRKYKFYLSLENSECEDYITEKVWENPLMHGVIPVVNGARRRNYEERLPPNSFIYVGDYNTTEELANYLKRLASEPALYAKYLEWQYGGSVVPTRIQPWSFCNLIPIIQKVQRGELQRAPVNQNQFSKTCRGKGEGGQGSSGMRIDGWHPW